MGYKSCFYAFALLAVLLAATMVGFAQGTTSRVTGTVTDNTGAAVSGATVTLTNEGTNVSLTTQTGDSGNYTFDLVQPGSYQVSIEKPGFKKFISKGNAALINQPTTVNVALQIGDVSAVVSVEGGAEQVQTSTSGNLGSTIEQKTLESLPIVGTRGRNPLDLLNFQPGVVFGGNTGGAVNVNGSRDRAFNFTLDGIDINESTAGGSNFTPLRPNPDSLQEFQIVTSNFTAELGRSSGAQVTLVTRSGTNQFKGSLFEYYQTPRFNAKSYASTIQPIAPKEQFVQHIFGGSFGGPLFNPGFGEGTKMGWLRDKAFFFVNLQMLRAYDTALVTRTVYTPTARQGIYRFVAGRANAPAGTATAAVDAGGNAILATCAANPSPVAGCINSYNINTTSPISIDPTLQRILNGMPTPNNYSVGDGLNTAGFDFASPQHEKQYDFSTKLDFKLAENNSFYIRYAQGEQNSFGDSGNGGRPIFPNSPNFVDTFRTPKNLAVNWRWSPTSNISNEAIFGISKFFFKFATPEPDNSLPFSFLLAATPNTNFSYNARGVTTYQYIDNLTYITGGHTIRGGINYRINKHKDDRSSVAGSAIEPIVSFGNSAGFTAAWGLPTTFNATTAPGGIIAADLTRLQSTLADYLGRINSISQAFVSDPANPGQFAPAGTRWINKATYGEFDHYIQDNWRIAKNLVFDIGVRWEARPTPKVDGRPILAPDQPVKLGAAPSNTIKWVERDLFPSRYNNILPSIGFAWDPFKDGKTSIRANYRMASDRFATFLFGSSIFQSAPGNTSANTNVAFGQGGGLYRNLAAVLPVASPAQTPTQLRSPGPFSANAISVIDPDLRYPQIHEWTLSLQREIMKGNVVEANYIGKHGAHLLGGYQVNQVNIFASDPRCPGETFLTAFTNAQNSVQTCLNALLAGSNGTGGNVATFRSLVNASLALGSVGTAAQTFATRSGTGALTANGFSPYFFQNFPQFAGGINVFDSSDYSNYHGLQLIFRRRNQRGLGFQVSYTYSKSLDNRSWDPSLSTISTGSAQSASSTPFDNRNRRINYSYSDFDRRHVVQGTYVWELPFGKGKMLNPDNDVLNYIIGGWQLSGTMVAMSGRPFTVYSGANTFGNVVQTTANCNNCARDIGSLVLENGRNFWFGQATRSLFSSPAPGQLGNTARNWFIAAPYFQTDASLSKRFGITERVKFDLRVDARNLTNEVNFDAPTAVINSTTWGRINASTTNSSRRIQFSGRLSF